MNNEQIPSNTDGKRPPQRNTPSEAIFHNREIEADPLDLEPKDPNALIFPPQISTEITKTRKETTR